jgi:DNA-binding MarR family transcriptional regulator
MKPARQLPRLSPSASRAALLDDSGDRTLRRLMWDLRAVGALFEEVRSVWGEALGISGPQWSILQAIDLLDEDGGVAVGIVAEHMLVKSTFVTAGVHPLVRAGLVAKRPSRRDRRIVLLSITADAVAAIDAFAEQRQRFYDAVFAGFDGPAFQRFAEAAGDVRRRFDRQLRLLRAAPRETTRA